MDSIFTVQERQLIYPQRHRLQQTYFNLRVIQLL